MKPFLNIDAGEFADEPEELYRLAHAVSIACGGHAGDADSMARALSFCAAHGTKAGAHPSYPDKESFGRTAMSMSVEQLEESIRAQCLSLHEVSANQGIALSHVKPHGALYHAANQDAALATAVIAGIVRALGTVPIIGPPRGALADAARAQGLPYLREGFADRGLLPGGGLVPRGQPGALIGDPAAAAAQAQRLAASGQCDTLCVHGDSPGALVIARAVRAALDA